MSVYKPAKSPYWQYDFQYQGRRYSGSTGAKTRKAADRVEQAKRVEAATGQLDRKAREAEIPTLGEAASEWWVFKGFDDDILMTRLDSAVELVGRKKLVHEITAADIAGAIRRRREKLVRGKTAPSNATVNRDIVCVIRPILKRQRKLLNAMAGAAIPFPEIDWAELTLDEPKPRARDFTEGDIGALFAALPHWWHDFARLQMRYGPRLGEMFFGLSNLEPEELRLLLTERKNGEDHTLPLLEEDAAMLAARLGRAKAAGLDTVWFRELKNGKLKALTYNAAKQAIRQAMRKSGLHARKKAKGSHDLRHHAAMQMLRSSKNLRVTQRLLGHRNINSTLVYAHALEDDVRRALEGMQSRNSPEPKTAKDETTKQAKGNRNRRTAT